MKPNFVMTILITAILIVGCIPAPAPVNGQVFGFSLDTKIEDICAGLNLSNLPDPSILQVNTKRDLDPTIAETLSGPGILEWEYDLERGIWQIPEGQAMGLPVGTTGKWSPFSSDKDMEQAWPIHVCNYGTQRQGLYGDLVINPILALGIK